MTSSGLGLSAIELNRWSRFASRGGIGKGVGLRDVEANNGDLMFFKGEEVIFLTPLDQDHLYLGFCEGVVGKFHEEDVKLTTKLKKAVLSPKNNSIPTAPPPYVKNLRSNPSQNSLSTSLFMRRESTEGSEISSLQVYYDAREDPGKGYGGSREWKSPITANFPSSKKNIDEEEWSESIKKQQSLDTVASILLSNGIVEGASSSPVLSDTSLLEPSLLDSPSSSNLDRDLPATPPFTWESEISQDATDLSEMETSFANSLSYYLSISPEPRHSNKSQTGFNANSNFDSSTRSESSFSQTTNSGLLTYHELLNSHFSDISLSDILAPYTSISSTNISSLSNDPIQVHSTFSSPSDSTSLNTSQQSNVSNTLNSRWSKCTYEETGVEGTTTDDTSTDIFDLYDEGITAERLDTVPSLSSPYSERSRDKNLLDTLLRGSIPGSISINSLVGGIVPSESNHSICSDLSTTSSSDWHNSSSVIASATLFHQPYFSPTLLQKQTSPSTSTNSHFDETTFKISAPRTTTNRYPTPLSPRSPHSSPRASRQPLSNFLQRSPTTISNLPLSDSNYSLASSTTSQPSTRKFSTLRPSFKTGELSSSSLGGPPRSFSCSTNIDSVTSSGYETPPLSSSRSRDFSSESSASPLSPASSHGRNSETSVGILTRFTSNPNRKVTVIGKPGVDYGFPISSKDFEEETVQLGNVEFEMMKPLVKILNMSEERKTQSNFGSRESSATHGSHYSEPPISPTIQLRSLTHSTRYIIAEETSIEEYRAKELKWIQAIGSGSSLSSIQNSKKMASLVQMGIPSSIRPRAYQFLSGVTEYKSKSDYSMLCDLEAPKRFERYHQDLAQTFIDHPLFGPNSQGRKDLKSVVKALCLWDDGLGYSSGICLIVAYFLTLADAQETFDLIVALIKIGTLKPSFENGGVQFKVMCLAFDILLEGIDPLLSKRLHYLGVESRNFLSSWTSSLFISVLPFSTMIQVIDLILFDPNYTLKVALAILQLNRARLLDVHASPEKFSIIKYLSNIPKTASSSTILLPTTFSLKIDSKIKKAYKKAEKLIPGGSK